MVIHNGPQILKLIATHINPNGRLTILTMKHLTRQITNHNGTKQ